MATKQDASEFLGHKFGRLTLIKDLGRSEGHKKGRRVLAICECGIVKDYFLGHVKAGKIVSCGCQQRENLLKRNYKHHLRRHPLYAVWCSMKDRCYNPNNIGYKRYGGRGIRLCDTWKYDFKCFFDWAIPKYRKGLYIDRIDNDGIYSPENCRWVGLVQSMRNMSNNRPIEYMGQTKCIAEWAEIVNMPASVIYDRLNKLGWSVQDAFTKPKQIQKC